MWRRDCWNTAHSRDLIKFYLLLSLRPGDIPQLLNTVDDIIMSMRTLRWILKSMSPTLWTLRKHIAPTF